MASPVSTTPTFSCSSSIRSGKPSISALSSSSSSYSLQLNLTSRRIRLSKQSSQLAQCDFASWAGLRSMSVSISPKLPKIGKKERCKGLTVQASLFGVGAPEALVIGVVALLVFGPKGLAGVARNLGKTLRAFQPTIRELQDVSREFKSTLEREIGLDDIPNSSQSPYTSSRSNSVSSATTSKPESPQTVSDPNGVPPNRAYSSEELLKITEEQLKASVAPQAKLTNSPEEKLAPVQESDGETASPQKPENEA